MPARQSAVSGTTREDPNIYETATHGRQKNREVKMEESCEIVDLHFLRIVGDRIVGLILDLDSIRVQFYAVQLVDCPVYFDLLSSDSLHIRDLDTILDCSGC
ncbi:unnamed protein product [Eruca vesicaria subsp. sativa]|uniref:Uncharacterized protein n=1 Tax=Eruca vesicaria subsp. sativa TaxID=29727 RepID=A0ABC8J416_ERUVS|nr:unnamed protein product [Eruca vesicaria subsp. sativa]